MTILCLSESLGLHGPNPLGIHIDRCSRGQVNYVIMERDGEKEKIISSYITQRKHAHKNIQHLTTTPIRYAVMEY